MFCFYKKIFGFTLELTANFRKRSKNEIFMFYLERKISEMERRSYLYKGKNYAENSISNYRKILHIWPDFEESIGMRHIRFADISIEVYYQFMEFCDRRNYMESTKYQYAALVKAVMNCAMEDGASMNNIQNSKGFVTHRPGASYRKVYLTPDEISRIAGLEIDSGTIMEKVRDVFLAGCYTGQRFSDYSDISMEEMETITVDGAEYKALRKIQRKTGNTVIIPVLDDNMLKIIGRWDGRLPKITISALNAHVKTLCRMAGIDTPVATYADRGGKRHMEVHPKYELVSSHTARRSYITNMYVEGILSPEQIRSISGHKSEESFKRYLCQNLEEEAKEIFKRYSRKS